MHVCVQRTLFQAVFMLFPTPAGGLFVRNEMFRTGPGAAALNNAAGGEMAQSFVKSYYDIFDSDRRALAAIYVRCFACCRLTVVAPDRSLLIAQRPSSMLLFEGAPAIGSAAILEKLAVRIYALLVLPVLFQRTLLLQALAATKHHIESMDSQPVGDTVVNVLITGKILVRAHAEFFLA